jgi:cysteine-rich repeat protein
MYRAGLISLLALLSTASCTTVKREFDTDASDAGVDVDAAAGTCGDGQVDPGEACDTSGVSTAECDSDCTAPACADGVFNPAAEECDDGNATDDGNGCDALCRRNSVCGDMIVQPLFEACDDGGQADGDGCSASCKQAVISLFPVSDRGGGDFDNNGSYDALNQESSTGEAIAWTGTEERRIAFEMSTSLLHPTFRIESAQFAFFPCCLSGQATVQLHGYFGNGAVELADMTEAGSIAEFLAADESARALDVQAFMQGAAEEQWPFTGFLLRLAAQPSSFFNLGVPTSDNADPNLRPRLNLVFCVDADRNGTCD